MWPPWALTRGWRVVDARQLLTRCSVWPPLQPTRMKCATDHCRSHAKYVFWTACEVKMNTDSATTGQTGTDTYRHVGWLAKENVSNGHCWTCHIQKSVHGDKSLFAITEHAQWEWLLPEHIGNRATKETVRIHVHVCNGQLWTAIIIDTHFQRELEALSARKVSTPEGSRRFPWFQKKNSWPTGQAGKKPRINGTLLAAHIHRCPQALGWGGVGQQ